MGPWGPAAPVRPERVYQEAQDRYTDHCPDICCDDQETCRCSCSWCDCRYAERMGS